MADVISEQLRMRKVDLERKLASRSGENAIEIQTVIEAIDEEIMRRSGEDG